MQLYIDSVCSVNFLMANNNKLDARILLGIFSADLMGTTTPTVSTVSLDREQILGLQTVLSKALEMLDATVERLPAEQRFDKVAWQLQQHARDVQLSQAMQAFRKDANPTPQ